MLLALHHSFCFNCSYIISESFALISFMYLPQQTTINSLALRLTHLDFSLTISSRTVTATGLVFLIGSVKLVRARYFLLGSQYQSFRKLQHITTNKHIFILPYCKTVLIFSIFICFSSCTCRERT